MRTTIELPDDLLRRAKAEAALRGVKFKDLVQESLQRLLESASVTDTVANATESPTVYVHKLPFRGKSYAMGTPNCSLDKALTLAGVLEDEEIFQKLTGQQ